MKKFSILLEKLLFTPSRNRKKLALKEYIANTPDPDRGYALAAITGDFKMKNITASFYHELIKEQVDYELFKMSYDYVGDLAETISEDFPLKERIEFFLEEDRRLIQTEDADFRFHSGVPVAKP